MTEKEFKKLKVGDRVRFSSYGKGDWRKSDAGVCYPPLGTEGTVVQLAKTAAVVEWDSGVYARSDAYDGRRVWCVGYDGIELVKPKLSDDDILKAGDLCVVDEYLCQKCPYKCKGADCEDVLLEDMHALAKRLKTKNEELEKKTQKLETDLCIERFKRAMHTVSVTAKEASENTAAFGHAMKTKDLEAQIKSLSDLLAEYENMIKKLGKKHKDLNRELDANCDRIHVLQLELDNSTKINNEYFAEIGKLREENAKLRGKLLDAEKHITGLRGDIDMLVAERNELKAENKELKEELYDFRSAWRCPFEQRYTKEDLKAAKKEGAKEVLTLVKDEIAGSIYWRRLPYFRTKYTTAEVAKIKCDAEDKRQCEIIDTIDRVGKHYQEED